VQYSPNIDDIGKIREKNGSVSLPNVKLKPEYAYSSELGVLQYFNNRMLSISANIYYTLLDNYITRAPFDRFRQEEGASTIAYDGEESLEVVANVNRGNASIKGGTLSFQGDFDHSWQAKGSVTTQKHRCHQFLLYLETSF
jgi:hemoglobin/transferrin/lactoferrin receptor protein